MSASGVTSAPQPWQSRSLKAFPGQIITALLCAIISITMALVVLILANDSPVDNWALAPTVFLSIIATTTGALLRFAFNESSDLLWWSNLLAGVPLRDLHTVWDIKHRLVALLLFRGRAVHLNLRLAATLMLLLALNGPLLQRTVTVELEVRPRTLHQQVLPVRRQPMWNLTTKIQADSGHNWSNPPYQKEFADVVTGLDQRQPMHLSQPACHPNAVCSTDVEIAGFSWACTTTEVPVRGVPSLFGEMIIPGYGPIACTHTGSDDEGLDFDAVGWCANLLTEFQMEVSLEYVNQTRRDLPWKDPELPPRSMNYTAFRLSDHNNETLERRECTFSTAFIQLPIEIANETIVTMLPVRSEAESNDRWSAYGVESIPAPILQMGYFPVGDYEDFIYLGFLQVMSDLFAGGIFYDKHYGSNFFLGTNSRQYINHSSITPRWNTGTEIKTFSGGYKFSVIDPLDEFVRTLNELSLRYALTELPTSEDRVREMEDYMAHFVSGGDYEDGREKAAKSMLKFSATTTADVRENKTVSVYKAQFAYTAAAIGVTYLTSVLVLFLLRSVWGTQGRVFSMSPLEIAKAFNAPLLANLSSNSTGEELAQTVPEDVKVRYGEAIRGVVKRKAWTPSVRSHESSEYISPFVEASRIPVAPGRGAGRVNSSNTKFTGAPVTSAISREDYKMGVAEHESMLSSVDEATRLLIDTLDRVSTPVNGRKYT